MEKSLFDNLLSILKEYRIRFLKGFLMLAVSNGLLILNPLILRRAVLFVDQQGERGIYQSSAFSWTFLLLSVALIGALLKYATRMTFITVSRDVEMELRGKIFGKIQLQSAAFFDKYGTGELLSRLTNDISLYRDVLGPGIMYPLFFITIVIPGIAALFSISKNLAVLALLPLFFIPLIHLVLRGPVYRASLAVQRGLGQLSGMAQEHFSSIRIIKSYAVEEEATKGFGQLSQRLLHQNILLAILQGALFPFFTCLAKLVTVALVFYTGYLIYHGKSSLTAADFVSFMWIQSYIFFPVLMLGWLLPVYERGRAAYDRLLEIYNEPIEVKDGSHADGTIPANPDISIEGLTFTYPTGKQPVLRDLFLHIPGGSFVGITGPIGGGKTTLFRLLAREYEIPAGMITIHGRDIHEYPLKSFYSQIVVVEQVPFIFSKTIAENVRFGRPEATFEEIVDVTRFADLHETVLEFPEQYETVIGERGVTLSGGQKLRLALARAFLVNRSILLLDDAFSAVDAETEARIIAAMEKNFKGKTLLLITHRASLLQRMDLIVCLDRGKILEKGTHSALIQQNGYYKALFELQQMGRGSLEIK